MTARLPSTYGKYLDVSCPNQLDDVFRGHGNEGSNVVFAAVELAK
jgi:hypothetical protein